MELLRADYLHTMLKALFKILFRMDRWTLHKPAPAEAFRCVMIAAPHTSNWDFVFAISAMDQLGLQPRFTIKREFNFFPLGKLIGDLGAIWIDRAGVKKQGMTEFMAALFEQRPGPLTVVVTPEGTRSKSTKWRTGFYFAALQAKLPICMAFMDYEKKLTGVGMCFMPSGELEADMKIIMDYYATISPKFPENFALDERYA
ncbi:MAG: 1-acyl-sn-glycerol-3-phosphate acyltransferase [Marinoscillum sp.]